MGLEIVSGGGLSLFMDEIISKHWSHHHHILILSHTSPHSSKLMSLLSPQADTGSSVYWHQSYNIMKMLESADVSAINLSINIESGQQTMGICTMCACLATLPMYWHERCVVCLCVPSVATLSPEPGYWHVTALIGPVSVLGVITQTVTNFTRLTQFPYFLPPCTCFHWHENIHINQQKKREYLRRGG